MVIPATPDGGKLRDGLKLLDIDASFAPLLEKYIAEIETFNPAYGLVKVNGRDELVVKHILDSLALMPYLSQYAQCGNNTHIADVGSGAGLPGIPLAVCLPETQFTLIEKMGRRCNFLRNACAVLGLSNVTIEEAEYEKVAPNRFDIVVFRALSPLNTVLIENLKPLLRKEGESVIVAYKGRRSVAEKEIACCGIKAEIIPLTVPFSDEERNFVILK
jgi:16S rRNA (guanine527-N7)-methyltransferase